MISSLSKFSDELADAVEHAGRSIVAVNEGGKAGVSGTLWREGLVVTAEHTIRGRQELTIEVPEGGSTTAKVIGRDGTTDIALLRLERSAASKPAVLADNTQLRVGHLALAVGRRGESGLEVSHGVISAIGGPWRTWNGGRIDRKLRLDLAPFSGFSGGPLINTAGEVIGVNTSGPRRQISTIPAETVNRVVDQLLAKGRVPRGFLGVALQPVQLRETDSVAARRGLLVVSVEPGGPADKAGMIVGDIILTFDGKLLQEAGGLESILDPEQVGKTIRLGIARGGSDREISPQIGERPE